MSDEKKQPTQDKDEPEIKFTDRRRVTEDGELREDAPEKEAPKEEAVGEEQPGSGFTMGNGQKLDFQTFTYSLFTQGIFALGDAPDPETNQASENLPLAKNTIDILEILEEKTKGNLSENEDKMLRTLLHELRLRFVQKVKKQG